MNTNSNGSIAIEQMAEKIKPYQIKIELFLLVCFSVGFILLQKDVVFSRLIITISLLVISALYFLIARVYAGGNKIIYFFNLSIYWAFSVIVVGILFLIQKWPGSLMMIQIGSVSIVLCLIGQMLTNKDDKVAKKNTYLNIIRVLIILAFLSGLYLNGDIDEMKKLQEQNTKTLEVE